MVNSKLLPDEDWKAFDELFPTLVRDLTEGDELNTLPPHIKERMVKLLNYNVPYGKKSRGHTVVLAYRATARDAKPEDLKLVYILGWCVEILQAMFLIMDDLMDESKTRRGRPCWYLLDDVGPSAVNDSVLLEQSIYSLISKYFSETPYLIKLYDTFHTFTRKTGYGQTLDMQTAKIKKVEGFTMDLYASIVRFKTSYYTFVLPAVLGMIVAGVKDEQVFKEVTSILVQMGEYFQIQDDYLDCFGKEQETGKIGSDIPEGKCSWLMVKAVEKADPAQKKILQENFGSPDARKIEEVKKIFHDLNLDFAYKEYEGEAFGKISSYIKGVKNPNIPKEALQAILQYLHQRKA